MKRKIEKYLSSSGKKKLKRDDGRYDFHGELDQVLNAVRDEGARVPSTGKKSSSKKNSSSSRSSSSSGGGGRTKRAAAAAAEITIAASLKDNSTDTPRVNPGVTSVKSSKLTANFDESLFTNDRSSTQTNSVSKALFGKTPSKQNDGAEDNSGNIFLSPRSALKYSTIPKKKGNKVNTRDKRDLRTNFTTGRASILATPQVSKKAIDRDLSEQLDLNFQSIKGFTPLSMVKGGAGDGSQFQDITSFFGAEHPTLDDGGLFSPGELFADVGNTFVDGIKTPKTPHASSHPRMCIANVRFGTTPKAADMKQRHVAISPIGSLQSVQQNKKKRRSLFDTSEQSEKKSRKEGTSVPSGLGMVTPSFSVSSNTTVTTYPLTVCSSAASIRTTMTLEELSKIKPIPINSTLQKDGSMIHHQTDCSGMEPKHITHQEVALENLSPITTVKKIDGHGSVEKFWSNMGGLDHLTPFRSDGASSSTPFNSE